MATSQTVINPAAALKSVEEQYNYLLATGSYDFDAYQSLQNLVDRWVAEWQQTPPQTSMSGPDANPMQYYIDSATTLSSRLSQSVKNAGLVAYSRQRDALLSGGQIDRAKLDQEIRTKAQNGASVEEIIAAMAATGQYNLSEMQYVASLAGKKGQFDLPATGDTGSGAIPGPGGGGGTSDFKPYEKVANDVTQPQDEFQKGFAQFTRQLTTSREGKAPQVDVMTARYQDLYNQWLGSVEAGRLAGTEDPNVWKEQYVNIGKSNYPQFDQKSDWQQLQTIRPKQSAYDWILANVDPEDVYASTPSRDRTSGSAPAGFRGYIRRTVG